MNAIDMEGDDTLISPRKSADTMMSSHSEPKRKPQRKKRTPRTKSPKFQPFMEQDEFSDIAIVVDDKRMYSSKALLAWHSPVFKQQLSAEGSGTGGKGARGGKASSAPKDLDLSGYKWTDVYDLVAYLDPRVDTNLTDREAVNLLPLAEEFEVQQLRKSCEHTITTSYYKLRRGRRVGSVPTDVTIKHLAIADKYKFDDLMHMCIEECVANDNPFSNKALTDSRDLSEACKVKVLEQKLDKLNMVLAKERRTVSQFKEEKEGKGKGGFNSSGERLWKR